MKKICGYKGKDDKFYESKEKCEIADLNFELKHVQKTLNSFTRRIEDTLFLEGKHSLSSDWEEHKYDLLDLVCRRILKDSDDFVKIINEKKNLEVKLDKLEKTIINKKWWLRVKWWKS